VIGNVDSWTSDNISGWAADEAHLDEVIFVELRINGNISCRIPARLYRTDLEQAGFGRGKHGFSFDPRPFLIEGTQYAELNIVGQNITLGAKHVDLADPDPHELFEISQRRWKGDEPPPGLTWGHLMTGDSFVDTLQVHWRPSNDTRMLEIGPGYGRILSTLLQRQIPFRSYCGVEISLARTVRLSEQFTDERIRFENGDINTHEFSEPADVVISSSTFVHLYPDCSKALKNIRSQVSKNAVIALDFMDPAHHRGMGFHDGGTYVRYYSRDELDQIFTESGYAVISMPEFVIGIGNVGGVIGEIFGLMVIARPCG